MRIVLFIVSIMLSKQKRSFIHCILLDFAKRTHCAKCGMANPNMQESGGIGGGYGVKLERGV